MRGHDVRPLLYSLGTLLAFLLMNLEIADAFSEGSRTKFQLLGGDLSRSNQLGRDMTYTLAWAAFAFTLLVVGFRKRVVAVRRAGMALLLVTVAKLFLYDMWNLGGLQRIAALIGLAVFGVYFARYFLGIGAPEEGAAITVTDTMTDDQRIHVTMDAMQQALDNHNLDDFMSIFSDDFQDSQNRSKTMLRALIQTYVSARGFQDLKLDLSQAKPTFEGDSGLFSPVYVTAEGKKYTLYVTGKKSNGRWLITNLSGI